MKSQIAIHRVFAAIAIALILTPKLRAGETIVDDARGFTLTLPDGFVPNPDLIGAAPGIVHAFVLGDPRDDELDIILFIEQMRGTIGREPFKPEYLPPDFQGRVFTTRWQEYDVDAFEVPEQLGEVQTITYNVQIPLKGAAIQVKLFGPADRESEIKPLLTETLAGLKGESNWSQSAAPSSLTSSQNYGVVLLTFAIVFILGGLVVLWLISRVAPKGVVLAIAAVIYCVGIGLTGVRVREVVMLTGALKMLGFAGGILGIVDLVRKREPKGEDAE
jgi:hypothetical protein